MERCGILLGSTPQPCPVHITILIPSQAACPACMAVRRTMWWVINRATAASDRKRQASIEIVRRRRQRQIRMDTSKTQRRQPAKMCQNPNQGQYGRRGREGEKGSGRREAEWRFYRGEDEFEWKLFFKPTREKTYKNINDLIRRCNQHSRDCKPTLISKSYKVSGKFYQVLLCLIINLS